MIDYLVEDLDETLMQELGYLGNKQYQEIDDWIGEPPKLEPNWDHWHALDQMGVLRIVTARDDGFLVGYFVYMQGPTLHYSAESWAMSCALYMLPEYRKGWAGHKLLINAMEDAKGCGVSHMVVNMRVSKPFRPLLKRLGFTLMEEVWEKPIE